MLEDSTKFIVSNQFHFLLSAVHLVVSNAKVANACPNTNSVILAYDVRMVLMNRHIYAIRNVYQAFSNGCTHRRGREVVSTVHSSVAMVDVVQLPSYVLVEMDAVTIVTKINAAYAVRIKF